MTTMQFALNSQKAFQFARRNFKGVSLQILALLKQQPMTCEEVAKRLGKYPNQISGRFRPMELEGLIVKDGTRATHTGCDADVWRAK